MENKVKPMTRAAALLLTLIDHKKMQLKRKHDEWMEYEIEVLEEIRNMINQPQPVSDKDNFHNPIIGSQTKEDNL